MSELYTAVVNLEISEISFCGNLHTAGGIYLLASSITSLLTVTMFTLKFWFVVLIQQYSIVRSSILRTDCVFVGPVFKLCLYLDGWLNTCVAIERTVNVSKGVNFDKKMSRHAARWVILILPIFIMNYLNIQLTNVIPSISVVI